MSATSSSTGTERTCDVLVAGGGAAGVAAAVAAGRAGARVLLVERRGTLGGLATHAWVGTICGLYLRHVGGPARYVHEGFAREWAERLRAATGVEPVELGHGLHVLPAAPTPLARLAEAFLDETPGVTWRAHTELVAAAVEHARITQVEARTADGTALRIRPARVVDATGEAVLARLAGAVIEHPTTPQAAAIVFAVDGVTGDAAHGTMALMRDLTRAVRAGELPPECAGLSLLPTCGSDRATDKTNGASFRRFKLTLASASTPDLESTAHAAVREVFAALKARLASFASARLAGIAPQVGVRDGPRIVGRARLSGDDVRVGRKCAVPEAARGGWPIEFWRGGNQPHLDLAPEDDFYEIAPECLRARDLDNLWAAGRCFCADDRAMASARVIGTALTTGWAAGRAAAEAGE